MSKHAGELIFSTVEMLQKGRGVKSLFGLILPYPTYMEIWNRAALTWRARQFAESSFTQRLVRLLTGFEKKRPANAQLRKCAGGLAHLRSWGVGDLEPHKPFEFQLCNSPSAGGVQRSCRVAELKPRNLP